MRYDATKPFLYSASKVFATLTTMGLSGIKRVPKIVPKLFALQRQSLGRVLHDPSELLFAPRIAHPQLREGDVLRGHARFQETKLTITDYSAVSLLMYSCTSPSTSATVFSLPCASSNVSHFLNTPFTLFKFIFTSVIRLNNPRTYS